RAADVPAARPERERALDRRAARVARGSKNGEAPWARGFAETDRFRRLGALTRAAHAVAVVIAAKLVSIGLVAVRALVELGRVLDLVLREVDENRLRVGIEIPDHTGGKHHFLAEDPRPRVDDDEAPARLVGRFIDLADAAIARLDLESAQVDVRWRRDRERPHLDSRHNHHTFLVGVVFAYPQTLIERLAHLGKAAFCGTFALRRAQLEARARARETAGPGAAKIRAIWKRCPRSQEVDRSPIRSATVCRRARRGTRRWCSLAP